MGSNFPNTFGKAPATEETYLSMVKRAVKAVSDFSADVQSALLERNALTLYPSLAVRRLY